MNKKKLHEMDALELIGLLVSFAHRYRELGWESDALWLRLDWTTDPDATAYWDRRVRKRRIEIDEMIEIMFED